jgi:hypothetical protein
MHTLPALLTAICLLAAAATTTTTTNAAADRIASVEKVPAKAPNKHYPSNRPPLAVSPLVKLPIGVVTPKGWLRTQLELQADGFIGHLTEISRWCKADGNAWLSPDGTGHSPWEELPYWLKGFGDTGYVLGNERIITEARKWVEGILASQRDDGWFGPRANLKARRGRHRARGKPDLWPNMIALNCLQSHYQFTGDKRVIELMTHYFRWQLAVPDEDFLPPFWQQQRASDNLASIHWLYNRTGEDFLLKLAEKIHRNMARWDEGIASWHGVNIAQCFRAPTIHWPQARTPGLLQGAYRNYEEVYALFGQMPGGMYAADENCRKGYDDPRQAAESCSMVEMMHSCEMLTRITGDPLWAERCEDVALNSYPASQPPDLKGLHYLTAPNTALLDRKNHSPGIQNRGCMLAYDPHRYRCCQHNVSHGWPYYAEELWLATADNGLCASLYAASEVTAKVSDEGTEVRISEQTDYPFGEQIAFTVSTPKAVRFPLYLRVPGWCEGARIAVNGQAAEAQAEPRSYLVIDRVWNDGDKVVLTLPMRLGLRVWTKNHNAVSVDRGPLTFSLKIGEEWKRFGGSDDWPAYEVFPTTAWNYGLAADPDNPGDSIEVAAQRSPDAKQPFTPEAAPIVLEAKARKLPQWQLDRHGLVAVLQDSPAYTEAPLETVTLIPMGCARLRISAFPIASTSADAHKWEEPPQPAYKASASHCWGGDTVEALCDGLLPKDSNDHSIPRMTWWDHKGTTEWVAYRFQKPRTLSWADVYWFDDTGQGQCRIPASWTMLYKQGEEWTEVKLAEGARYGVEKDAFNKIAFEPVETQEVRLQVQLQGEFSSGILEWRVGPKPKKE